MKEKTPHYIMDHNQDVVTA